MQISYVSFQKGITGSDGKTRPTGWEARTVIQVFMLEKIYNDRGK